MIQDLRNYQPGPPEGRILLLGRGSRTCQVEEALSHLGMTWDRVGILEEARRTFFAWGGHEALLITPGTPAGPAREVVYSLRDMDPNLPVLTFLDPGSLGNHHPPCITLNDLDPGCDLGRRLLSQRIGNSIHRSRT